MNRIQVAEIEKYFDSFKDLLKRRPLETIAVVIICVLVGVVYIYSQKSGSNSPQTSQLNNSSTTVQNNFVFPPNDYPMADNEKSKSSDQLEELRAIEEARANIGKKELAENIKQYAESKDATAKIKNNILPEFEKMDAAIRVKDVVNAEALIVEYVQKENNEKKNQGLSLILQRTAQLFDENGQNESAIHYYEKAYHLWPENINIQQSYAVALAQADKCEMAIPLLKNVLTIADTYAELHPKAKINENRLQTLSYLAQCQFNTSSYEAAKISYERVISFQRTILENETTDENKLWLANTLIRTGHISALTDKLPFYQEAKTILEELEDTNKKLNKAPNEYITEKISLLDKIIPSLEKSKPVIRRYSYQP